MRANRSAATIPCSLALIFCLVGVSPATAEPVETIRSFEELTRFTNWYYLEPHPELVPEAIDFLAENRVL